VNSHDVGVTPADNCATICPGTGAQAALPLRQTAQQLVHDDEDRHLGEQGRQPPKGLIWFSR
jgi:hypothetical protein